MPEQPKRRARRASPKRAAIVQAATEEFLSHGFSGTSMDRIALSANVSKRTVYDHFPSKEDLFHAIIDEILQKVDAMPAAEVADDEPLEDQLLAIGSIFAQTITERDFMKLSRAVISRFIQSPEWAVHTAKAHARLRQEMTAFFKTQTANGRLSIKDADYAATQFCGLIKEVVFWPELMAGQAPSTSLERTTAVKAAVEMFLDHYRQKD